jgi:small subunit ribosomal protein S17
MQEAKVERNTRKTFIGVVESNKMDKTIVVRIQRLVKHPMYQKYIKRSTKLTADDPENTCNIGDKVQVMATRPVSKRKRWRLVRVVERAK